MALGPRDLSSLVALTGWDATVLQDWALQQDGTPITQILTDLRTVLASLNAESTGGLWGSLISFQDFPEVEYLQGASNGFEQHTEYGVPDAKRASTEGHMIPLVPFDRGLGWTWDYLRRARVGQLQADISSAVVDARALWRTRLLGRLLKRTDDSGTSAGLGSSGYSPGFATTAASTNVDFTPPTWGGTTFTSTHEHYNTYTGGAFTAAVFTDARADLREHGHEPPYDYIVGSADATAVAALTEFTPTNPQLLRIGLANDVAVLPTMALTEGVYSIGTIAEFAVHVVAGMPQYYGFGWKSYGQMAARNPLRVRLDKGMTSLMFQAFNDPRNGSPAHPLQFLMLFTEFGVGVADRTNGVPAYVNNATWADGVAG